MTEIELDYGFQKVKVSSIEYERRMRLGLLPVFTVSAKHFQPNVKDDKK